jgi:hypothetical protein
LSSSYEKYGFGIRDPASKRHRIPDPVPQDCSQGKCSKCNQLVLDSHWFQCRSGSGSSILGQCGSGSLVLMTKNLTAEKNPSCLHQKGKFFLSLCLHEGGPSYRRSLNPPKENIPRGSKYEISSLFTILWATSALLDPDPADETMTIQVRFQIRIDNTDTDIPHVQMLLHILGLEANRKFKKENSGVRIHRLEKKIKHFYTDSLPAQKLRGDTFKKLNVLMSYRYCKVKMATASEIGS